LNESVTSLIEAFASVISPMTNIEEAVVWNFRMKKKLLGSFHATFVSVYFEMFDNCAEGTIFLHAPVCPSFSD